jgi:DNA-binding beta-propeller fold protein YncE
MTRLLAGATLLAVLLTACTGDSTTPTVTEDTIPGPDASSTTIATDTEVPSTAANPPVAGERPAPEFPDDVEWLNTDQPLTLEALRGKVVLLDFWTYGCINCIHIIPDLKRLEAEYPNELVVIGVHSAKFANEAETDNIRQVILRYELEHPVVNDKDFAIWNSWGAGAWPTVALIDPAGGAVGTHSGEGVYELVQPIVDAIIEGFDATGQLDRSPIKFALEADRSPETVLSFPGKIFADPGSQQLFIADSGHHRIVVADADTGEVTAVYGSGTPGFRDGSSQSAQFHSPQGMALSADGTTLFVADTNNHAIRTVSLAGGVVGTLAGTGEIGWPPTSAGFVDTRLNSPWALTLREGSLYVANAGTHQIWELDLAAEVARPLVGSSAEGTRNGPLPEAELAQPSGLAFGSSGELYFADSESSSIRSADVVTAGGETRLVAGAASSLFEFGDEDGTGPAVRLQHPLGVAAYENTLLIADTYNSKIKQIEPTTGDTTTLFGGENGWQDGSEPRFYEPGGLAVRGDTLYVADTNNHVIRHVDLGSGTASTLVLKGIERFIPPPTEAEYGGTVVTLDPVAVAAGPGVILLDIQLPPGHKVNEEAPSSIAWEEDGVARFPDGATVPLTGATFPVEIPVDLVEGSGNIRADATIIYCRDDAESLCLIEQVRFEMPVTVGAESSSVAVRFEHVIPESGF